MRQELLRMENICKRYYDNRVLKNAGFNLFRGETLAIIGENGAGKSTLIKILCGIEQMDYGSVYVREQRESIPSPQKARELGIHFILQDPALVPGFTVSENIFLFYSYNVKGLAYRKGKAREIAGRVLQKLGIGLDPDALAGKLSLSQQYLLEIAMAVSTQSSVLVMDETTASLNARDVRTVKRIIGDYKKRGNGVLFVSHNIDEVLDIADRIVILRDGMNVGNLRRQDFSKEKIVKLLVGKEMDGVYRRQEARPGKEALALRHATAPGIRDISLSMREGEILGVTGLIGSGKTQLANAIFGLAPLQSGELWIGGAKQEKYNARLAMKKGVAFIPEDKQALGLLNNMDVSENVVAAILGRLGSMGYIKDRARRHVTEHYIRALHMSVQNTVQPVDTLSGGNQQKVIIARWLAAKPRILVADEPTMGLDMRSRAEVYAILDALAKSGMAVLLISSHIPEIVQMCDRALVLSEGRIKGELSRELLSKEGIIGLEVN